MKYINVRQTTRLFLISILFVLPCSVFSTQQVVIIGGGPNPLESQSSIELNTKWIIDIIEKRNPGSISDIMFTDGNSQTVDVHKLKTSTNTIESLQPLARIYGKDETNNYHYYSSNIAQSVTRADRKNVTERLKKVFYNLKAGDELFLIYQGHGGHKKDNTNENYLRLWGNTKLTVTELESLMTLAHPDSVIRFIFPQCFSGAFAKLIYIDAISENGLAVGNRCGFLAQNDHEGSEGCTASVEKDSYRDYSGYFFSALNRKSINDEPLLESPDYNQNAEISMKEAHIYSLRNAFSVDYSRSTSEDYLQEWQPWYMKWLPYTTKTDGMYKSIIYRIASRFDIRGNDKHIISAAADRLITAKNIIQEKKSEREILKKSIKTVQNRIQQELVMLWPQLKTPYTGEYRQILINDIDKINQSILMHHDYPSLVKNQQAVEMLSDEIQELIREVAQMRKIFRMFKMQQILDQFNRYSSEKEKAEYKQLVECENSSFLR